MNTTRIEEVTREVCETLGADLEGQCAIGAATVAARLIAEGFRAELVEGQNRWESHVWVRVEDVVADPTIGQFEDRSCDSLWHVGPPDYLHTEEAWDHLVPDPDFEQWPEEQAPQGPQGRRYLSKTDLETLGLKMLSPS